MKKLMEELFARYYRDVYRYLYSLCRDGPLAEDLASEVFLEVVRSIAGFRGESDVKTWLFTIARRRWYAHLRKKSRDGPREQWLEYLAAEGKPLEEQMIDKAALERIRAILEGEPERTQRIVRMRMEGYSYHEIANAAGVSESSARVIDFRAREKLRRILQKEGFTNV